jgi:TonB family protein
MIQSSRYETSTQLDLKIPWDTNTARGFIIALGISILLLIISPVFEIAPPTPHELEVNTIPIELLNFGSGDGTGMSKGNLSEEGQAHKGKEPSSNLADAQIAANSKTSKNSIPDNDQLASNYKPVDQMSSNDPTKAVNGSSNRNTGSMDGSESGSGLGKEGFGPGKGDGFGPIEWGGGGNRVVLYKKLPSFPPGANTSAQIKIKFTVMSDGTVSHAVPLQKGDPMLERAALDALKQWRFNPLKDNREMVGIITFTFKLS